MLKGYVAGLSDKLRAPVGPVAFVGFAWMLGAEEAEVTFALHDDDLEHLEPTAVRLNLKTGLVVGVRGVDCLSGDVIAALAVRGDGIREYVKAYQPPTALAL